MATFVYHSRLPGALVPLMGIPTMLAFVIFAVRAPIPDHYLFWLFLIFFGAAATGGFILYRFLDRITRRVQEVASGLTGETRTKKVAGTKGGRAQATKRVFGESDWEVGPRGLALIPHWIATFFFVSLAAIVLGSQLAMSRLPGYSPNQGALWFCVVCAAMTLLIWQTVVRLRSRGRFFILCQTKPFAKVSQVVPMLLGSALVQGVGS